MNKKAAFFLSRVERIRISEALGMLVADQSEGTRNYYWDKRLMQKWDTLLHPGKVQIISGGKRK